MQTMPRHVDWESKEILSEWYGCIMLALKNLCLYMRSTSLSYLLLSPCISCTLYTWYLLRSIQTVGEFTTDTIARKHFLHLVLNLYDLLTHWGRDEIHLLLWKLFYFEIRLLKFVSNCLTPLSTDGLAHNGAMQLTRTVLITKLH